MCRRKKRQKIFSVILLLHFFFSNVLLAWAASGSLNINFIAVNAGDEVKELDLKQKLPEELVAEDIQDAGNLRMEYDVDSKTYYVVGKAQFQPKESKTFKIKVRDVWQIKPEEVDILKKQLEQNVETLQDHESYGAAKEMQQDMIKQMDYILAQQDHYSDNIERRIEEYRAYRGRLDLIRNNIYSQDFLRYESKALKETRDNMKTIKFVVEVKNPSPTETRTITQKHYLPQEIRAEDVIDNKGFEVRYDDEKERAYLTKEETFSPGETKKYEIAIKDIWHFPMIKLTDLTERSTIAQGELDNTIYRDSAAYLIGKINVLLAEIKSAEELAKANASVETKIGLYRTNTKRYQEARDNFKRIEEMIDIVRAKKLEELSKGKVKNVLQRLKALRGLKKLSEAIFKKAITVTMTWRIIMGAILFVAAFTTFHFIIWAKRSGKQGEEMGVKGNEGIKVVPKPGEQQSKEET